MAVEIVMINNVVIAQKPTVTNKKLKIKDTWFWGYLFISPIILGIIIFSIVPIFYSFYMSLTQWDSLTPPVFVGLQNFIELFSDKQILKELLNTMYYTIGTVPVSLALSIMLANALNQKIPAKSMYRVIYFLPSVTMPVAIAIVWQWLFNSKMGLVNQFLLLFGIKGPMWLGDVHFIMPAIIIVSIWSSIGYNMVILLAGLQGIPQTYYEAAEIDGASKWLKFVKITLPMLTPSIFFLFITSLIGAFKAFDIIFMFAGANSNTQGPLLEVTRTMVFGIYEKGFTFLRMGYASAEAILLFVIIMVVTVIQFIFQKKWVHYE
jgi:multiple sugar transport system permease protein